MDFQEVGLGGLAWIDVAQDRYRCRALCECGTEPSGFIKCREFVD